MVIKFPSAIQLTFSNLSKVFMHAGLL